MPHMASLARKNRHGERQSATTARNAEPVLTAAAANVRIANQYANLRFGATDWQEEGWVHYDTCGEFRSGVNILAYHLSRARLIGVEVDPVTGAPRTEATDDPDVTQAMRDLFGGPTGQSQALDRIARHLTVAGDLWCLATMVPDPENVSWEILSGSDVTGSTNRIMLRDMTGTQRPFIRGKELLFRVWRPHPKRRWEADSTTKPLLPILREIALLAASVTSAVRSRLASAGILWLPEDLQLPKPNLDQASNAGGTQAQSYQPQSAEGWLDLITEAMMRPIEDPESAAAVVPLVSIVKADSIAKINHMEFGRDLDQTVEPLRTASLRRLAVSMDLPPEFMTGMAATNHWTSWTITEEFAKAYLAPLLELIVDAATQEYLRPLLTQWGRDAKQYAVWFDLTALFPRQVAVDNAQAAYDAGLLKEVAYLQALGFGESEMATPQERARRLIEDMVKRGNPQTIAELGQTILMLYGIRVDTRAALPAGTAAPPATPAAAAAAAGTEPTPALTSPAPPARPPADDTSGRPEVGGG